MSDERSPSNRTSFTERSDELIRLAFARLDRTALGVGVGALVGLLVFSATVVALLKDGGPLDPNLELLAQYYPAYTVTWKGAFVGLFYGFLSGFLLGWLIALLRNASLGLFLRFVQKKAELSRINEFLDRV